MIIDKVRLKNFRSHSDTELEFGRGITVIIGDNGAGKTSILEAISFALFKEKPDGVSVDELMSLGKNESDVSLLFHSNGRQYRVRRKRSGKRGAESFFHHLTRDLESLIVKGEREVTREVEETLGINGELFTSAVYIKQGEIDRLLSTDASTRKRHIGKLLGTEDMENAHRNFLELIREFENRVAKVAFVPEEIKKRSESLAIAIKEHQEVKKELTELSRMSKKVRAALKASKNKVEKLDSLCNGIRDLDRLHLELVPIEKDLNQLADFEKELKETEEGNQNFLEVEALLLALSKEIQSFDVIREQLLQGEKNAQELDRQKKSYEDELQKVFSLGEGLLGRSVENSKDLQEGLAIALEEQRRKLRLKESEKEESSRQLVEKKTLQRSLHKNISELKQTEGGSCPTCGRELTEEHRRELLNSYSSDEKTLIADIKRLGQVSTRISQELMELNNRLKALERIDTGEFIRKEDEISSLQRKREEIGKVLSKHRKSLDKLKELLEKKDSLEADLKGLRPLHERYVSALGFLRKNLSAREGLEKKMAEITRKTRLLEEGLKIDAQGLGIELEEAPTLLLELKKEHQLKESRFQELLRMDARLSSAAELKEKRIGELEDEISELNERLAELDRLKRFRDLLDRLRALFHKDALQLELRLQAKPLIEEYTRDIFMSFNLPYNDLTLTDDYSLKVHGDKGEESLDMLSGGERIAAALALRVGLSRALSGPLMELIILDEPTIHLDAHRRRELVEVIRRLAIIPQTIVVTHDKEFEESADRIIEVEKVNGVSMVK